jgi:hypothetical protein
MCQQRNRATRSLVKADDGDDRNMTRHRVRSSGKACRTACPLQATRQLKRGSTPPSPVLTPCRASDPARHLPAIFDNVPLGRFFPSRFQDIGARRVAEWRISRGSPSHRRRRRFRARQAFEPIQPARPPRPFVMDGRCLPGIWTDVVLGPLVSRDLVMAVWVARPHLEGLAANRAVRCQSSQKLRAPRTKFMPPWCAVFSITSGLVKGSWLARRYRGPAARGRRR